MVGTILDIPNAHSRILGNLVGSVRSYALKIVSFERAHQNALNDVLKSLAD